MVRKKVYDTVIVINKHNVRFLSFCLCFDLLFNKPLLQFTLIAGRHLSGCLQFMYSLFISLSFFHSFILSFSF